jgi:hypothetical protein
MGLQHWWPFPRPKWGRERARRQLPPGFEVGAEQGRFVLRSGHQIAVAVDPDADVGVAQCARTLP